MLSVLVLAGVCSAVPFFPRDFTGPLCADYSAECRCSECFTWNPPTTGGTVRQYDVNRTNPDGTTQLVGSVLEETWKEPDGTTDTAPPAPVWCPYRDATIPSEGSSYLYRVRACNGAGCSPWSDAVSPASSVQYVTAPVATTQFRPPVKGNP